MNGEPSGVCYWQAHPPSNKPEPVHLWLRIKFAEAAERKVCRQALWVESSGVSMGGEQLTMIRHRVLPLAPVSGGDRLDCGFPSGLPLFVSGVVSCRHVICTIPPTVGHDGDDRSVQGW